VERTLPPDFIVVLNYALPFLDPKNVRSEKIELTDSWVKVLDNQTGAIFNESINAVSICVNDTVEETRVIKLPADGFNFQSTSTVWIKNYNSAIGKIGVIK
jgi:hypothetical protein